MTVLSRALIRRLVILEMKKAKLGSGLSFKNTDMINTNDDDNFEFDETDDIDIDSDTIISDLPSFFNDTAEEESFDYDNGTFEPTETLRPDRQRMVTQMYDDDLDSEDYSETEVESETEYNPGRRVMDMSRDEIRKHVMSAAAALAPEVGSRNNRTRAEMRYDDLAKQGREAEMPDPEFMDTRDLEGTLELPANRMRKKINESIRSAIRRYRNL
jgi:hypothetical protein